MEKLAIKVDSIGKKYQLKNTASDTLASTLNNLLQKRTYREFWALQNISFELQQGTCLSIIGPNGAGKSTLLKIFAGITLPTVGKIEYHGSINAMLEIGTGFHPELTGKENVYLNGSLMGLSRNEISRRFEEIVSFSGVGEFIDMPLKTYSSGMTVRLGFAVAAHTKPDILILDEVLAVGDFAYQQKCIEKMVQLKKNGTTILFVSHNIQHIKEISDACTVLVDGKNSNIGTVEDSLKLYLEAQEKTQQIDHLVQVVACNIIIPGRNLSEINVIEKILYGTILSIELKCSSDISNVQYRLTLHRIDGLRIMALENTKLTNIEFKAGQSTLNITLNESIYLTSGLYYWQIAFKVNDLIIGHLRQSKFITINNSIDLPQNPGIVHIPHIIVVSHD